MSPAAAQNKTPVALKLALVAVALIVAAGAGYFLLVQPKTQASSTASKEITRLNQEISATREQNQQAAGLSKILVADFYKLKTAMPDTPSVPELMLELGVIAHDSGVSFTSIVPPAAPIASTDYQVIPIPVTFEGSFYNLTDFVHRLQSLVLVVNHKLVATGRLYTIDQIDFVEGDAKFPDIKATLTIDAFIYGVPPAPVVPTIPGSTDTTGTSTDTTDTSTTAAIGSPTQATTGVGS